MSYSFLPTPQKVTLKRCPPHGPFGKGNQVACGTASPLTFAPEVDEAVRTELSAWLSTGEGAVPIALTCDPELGAETSCLRVTEQGINLAASSNMGWHYGLARLRQLRYRGFLPVGQIDDAPALAMRGFHLNFNNSSLDFDLGKQLLESMARWRLNTVLVEYGRRYPYRDHPGIASASALTRQQVADLIAYARALGIEPIPLQQCLGHVEYILQHDAYADLREEEEQRDQFCPLNPKSIELFRELVDDMIDLHPNIRYMHIGGDETRRLGNCPRCAEVAKEHGKGRLYLDYHKQAIEYVCSRGLTPIIWDDMLCKYPEVIEQMPREAVIMYWDYWTTCDPSALFVARPAGMGVVTDSGWNEQWQDELGETEARTVRRFTGPVDLAKELSPEFQSKFGPYLGPHFPKRIRAFPYLEYYQELGFRVIGAPTGSGNTSTWRQLPDFPRYGENIHTFSKRIHEAGALGLITSAWYPVPFEAWMPGIMFTGQFTWNPDVTE